MPGVPSLRLMRLAALLAPLLTMPVASADTVEGLNVASGGYDARLIRQLDRAVEDERFRQINSVVVLRDGELLIERYYNGAGRDDTHNPRSVGKTVAATVLGIAIDEGYLQGVDQRLAEFYDLESYDNYSEKKAQVTLRQLLMMSSGFDGFDFEADSIGNEENMYPQPDWVEWTLKLPMAADREPGDEWRYFTAGVVVLGDIINSAVPGGLVSYTHKKLFGPIGVTNYQWQHTPQRVGNTAGGLQLTPIGFAKYGEVHRTGGLWGDRRVLPQTWAETMLRPQIVTTEPGNEYGYLWWHKSYQVGDERWPVAYCSGNGGNKIFVFEEQPLVVVVTASAYGQRYGHRQVDEMMEQFILPAVAGSAE